MQCHPMPTPDPRDTHYRDAVEALERLWGRRNRTGGATAELDALEGLLLQLRDLRRAA